MTKEPCSELTQFLISNKVSIPYNFIPIKSGRNNRVFHVNSPSGNFLLKKYHQHPEDKRDRMGTEFEFLQFLWENKIQHIPEPIAYDTDHFFGLYSFLDGSRPNKISPNCISQAARFIHQINLIKRISRNNSS